MKMPSPEPEKRTLNYQTDNIKLNSTRTTAKHIKYNKKSWDCTFLFQLHGG